jgi:hypothetical protein
MGFFEDEMSSEKVLWIKKTVRKLDPLLPDDPSEKIHELKITHFPEFGNGVFIKYTSTRASEDDDEEYGDVFIPNKTIPELISALQRYLDSQ